jgi:hypothetical protein
MGYLIELTLGIGGNLIAAELIFRHKRWCQRIIRSAARRIGDPRQSEIKSEEWLAALNDHVGMIASFSHAIGCWIGAPAVAAALRRPIPEKAARDRSRLDPRTASEHRLVAFEIRLGRVLSLRFAGVRLAKLGWLLLFAVSVLAFSIFFDHSAAVALRFLGDFF